MKNSDSVLIVCITVIVLAIAAKNLYKETCTPKKEIRLYYGGTWASFESDGSFVLPNHPADSITITTKK